MCRPSGFALLPSLRKERMMRFVDDRPVKEGVVAFLQKQHQKRRKKVRSVAPCFDPLHLLCSAIAATVKHW